ncbi:molybdenum cofactor guanylyltransferase [Demequina sp. NBRC 110056]|uniref:molybdenum cofactor guanylyltransferase n=1 Tax=Demequina sp. NBRC 110056 TaxID=1570345 RepID=UPI00117BEDF0|nr:NTP transferase domain-containing protein [Demequina sp. NBRC 110056]
MTAFDAIILSGGRAERLGGVDKGTIEIGGRTLLSYAFDAAAEARAIAVVGPPVERFGVISTREDPPGGGPVAGIAAGLKALAGGVNRVLVLAVDTPRGGAAIPDLLAAVEPAEAAIAVDEDGRDQPLLGVYKRAALESALARLSSPDGASMRSLLRRLTIARVPVAAGVSLDADTWDDVRRLREQWS